MNALTSVIDRPFQAWNLKLGEGEAGILALKGCAMAETADFRRAIQGTVRVQVTRIQSKAGTSIRANFTVILA